jgi:succinoglycan biosynthesis transport protein ExoP
MTERPPTLAHYLAVLMRRKWVVLTPLLIIPALAFFLARQQPSEYRASSQVLLNRQDIVGAVANVSQQLNSAYLDPERLAITQSDVARSPLLIEKVVSAANIQGLTASGFRGNSQVSPRANADVLEFSVTDRNPDVAAKLATLYAEQYTLFRREIDTKALREAMDKLQVKVDQLKQEGMSSSEPLYAQLLDAQTKLETATTLLTANTTVIQPAEGSEQIAPRPRTSAVLGGLVAVVLALGLAFLAEALDKRVRNVQEAEDRLGLPQLGRLPRPSARIRLADDLVMLADPASPAAEAVRQLRSNVEFAIARTGVREIMVTSALEREGKSITAANLAVALAKAGRRVVLIDLDLRRPSLHRVFKTPSSPGLVEVSLGQAELDDVLTPILISTDQAAAPMSGETSEPHGRSVLLAYLAAEATNGHVPALGALEFLPSGELPRDPGEFVAGRPLGAVLAALRERTDVILIDVPPMLTAGDAATLSPRVDGLLAVVRLRQISRAALMNFRRQLEKCPAVKLGFVATDAPADDGYGSWYDEPYLSSEPAPGGRKVTR